MLRGDVCSRIRTSETKKKHGCAKDRELHACNWLHHWNQMPHSYAQICVLEHHEYTSVLPQGGTTLTPCYLFYSRTKTNLQKKKTSAQEPHPRTSRPSWSRADREYYMCVLARVIILFAPFRFACSSCACFKLGCCLNMGV